MKEASEESQPSWDGLAINIVCIILEAIAVCYCLNLQVMFFGILGMFGAFVCAFASKQVINKSSGLNIAWAIVWVAQCALVVASAFAVFIVLCGGR